MDKLRDNQSSKERIETKESMSFSKKWSDCLD